MPATRRTTAKAGITLPSKPPVEDPDSIGTMRATAAAAAAAAEVVEASRQAEYAEPSAGPSEPRPKKEAPCWKAGDKIERLRPSKAASANWAPQMREQERKEKREQAEEDAVLGEYGLRLWEKRLGTEFKRRGGGLLEERREEWARQTAAEALVMLSQSGERSSVENASVDGLPTLCAAAEEVKRRDV
ncbi:hypothetical protein NA57DRAFT_55946 [Rhizodiscina lignyota]|uniref:Uncharacterized protein n=1 Tax=Rhizodiscina lignyota TaxID=1504668 RepID=A0A9P4MBS6_9PEZI|nr:hypothetical protein NA57DRAFT_55946 [Rhizodiscina lignyota]